MTSSDGPARARGAASTEPSTAERLPFDAASPGREDGRARRRRVLRAFVGHSVYEFFEHVVMLVLTVLLALVIAASTWHLVRTVVVLLAGDEFDPANPDVFRDVFGMFFTVLIALEFKRSFLLVSATQQSIVRVRSIVLIGLLATVRRLIVLDLKEFDVGETLATAGAILALGLVYWLVRDQDARFADDAIAPSVPSSRRP